MECVENRLRRIGTIPYDFKNCFGILASRIKMMDETISHKDRVKYFHSEKYIFGNSKFFRTTTDLFDQLCILGIGNAKTIIINKLANFQ